MFHFSVPIVTDSDLDYMPDYINKCVVHEYKWTIDLRCDKSEYYDATEFRFLVIINPSGIETTILYDN